MGNNKFTEQGVYCPKCNFYNSSLDLICQLCGTPLPNCHSVSDAEGDEWDLPVDGEQSTEPPRQSKSYKPAASNMPFLIAIGIGIAIIVLLVILILGKSSETYSEDSSQTVYYADTEDPTSTAQIGEGKQKYSFTATQDDEDMPDKLPTEDLTQDEFPTEDETHDEFPTEDLTQRSVSDYILPDSADRYLTEADLKNLTWEECCYARNEIFARHGRIFKTPEIMDYFESQSWYEGTISGSTFDANLSAYLNDIERSNATFILDYEKKNYGGSYY